MFSLRQDCNQRWKWFGAIPGTNYLIESLCSWEYRKEAEDALARHLNSARYS